MSAARVEPGPASAIFETDIPSRLDRLAWGRFHWLVITALGITWVLDGLEVTLVGALSGAMAEDPALALNATRIGLAASAYLAGAIIGALGFGHLTDAYGRKRLFTVTVAVYAVSALATGLSWNFWSFAFFRFMTGMGIGGEYGAINSAIDELIPARCRGWTDLAINGSFWIGAALGAGGSLFFLDPALIPPAFGWRIAFATGGVLAVIVIALRRYIPESPRWLMTHGRGDEAEAITRTIEARTEALAEAPLATLRLHRRERFGLWPLLRAILRQYPRRAALGLVLMAAQAFFYNAIFFTYALVLGRFYGVPAGAVGRYIIAFAIGNFFGPLLLGRYFDSHGRKPMMVATYGLAGVLMVATALLFGHDVLDARALTAAWTVIFFFASAAASAAYLTVGETFPLEARALIIAIFYAGGTAIGGLAGPALFGALLDQGSRAAVMWGYLGAAVLMLIAAAVEAWLGVAAERRSLESVAAPLSSADPGSTATK
ncbi:MAG TPA: MFS transporter [Stellaceae bacterium]|nr:MFS transporter [Stellaceae bacterium]